MGKAKLFLTLGLIGALFLAGLFGIMLWMQSGSVDEAERLGDSVLDYLDDEDVSCRAAPSDFQAINACLDELTTAGRPAELLELDDVEEFDDGQGAVILENTGDDAYASSNFTLLLNKEITDQQCTIDGRIDPGYVCKLTFDRPCDSGDVLEITYNGERVHLETC